jgi:hypothetical protein
VPIRNPQALAAAIQTMLDNPEPYKHMAARGRKLITNMFDVERTGREVAEVYRHIVERRGSPIMFCVETTLNEIEANEREVASRS